MEPLKNIFRIGKVKSDIRRIIRVKCIKNGVTTPFPQMDLHVKSNAFVGLRK
jgi:small-conductance mechanosensitive channel